MSILFADGFETYGLGQDRTVLDDVYNFTNLTNDDQAEIIAGPATAEHVSQQAVRLTTAGISTNRTMRVPLSGLTSATELIVGVRIRAESQWTDRTWPLIQWYGLGANDAAGLPPVMLSLCTTATGNLSLRRGSDTGTELEADATALSVGVWYYIEFKVVFHGSAGSYEVRVNGAAVMSGSGVNTTATGTTQPYEVAFSHGRESSPPNLSQHMNYDDLVIVDTAGTVNNTFLGDISIMRVRPNAVGDESGFTPSAASDNYALVNEDAEDDDAGYVQTATVAAKDLYHFEDVASADTILGVVARPVVKKGDGGSRTYRLLAKSNGTEDQTDARYPSGSYVRQSYIWETDPDTGALWDLAAFNAAQFGAELVS